MITENDIKHISDVRGLLLAYLYDEGVIQQSPEAIASGVQPTVEEPPYYITNTYHCAIDEYDRAKTMTDEEFLMLMREEYSQYKNDVPLHIESIRKFNQHIEDLQYKLRSWNPTFKTLQNAKFVIGSSLVDLIYPEKLIQDFESIYEMSFDDSPEAIAAYKKDYIDRSFRVLNAAEDSYKTAWLKYQQNHALLDEALASLQECAQEDIT